MSIVDDSRDNATSCISPTSGIYLSTSFPQAITTPKHEDFCCCGSYAQTHPEEVLIHVK